MAVLIPRSRTISVRLSADEFAALERHCANCGARSISDFAREAICSFLPLAGRESELFASMGEYSAHVKHLERKVASLAAEIASLKADTRANTPGAGDGSRVSPGELATVGANKASRQ